MKKLAIATLGLAVLSTSAFASKARLEALGQDADGSMWIDDQRNVFLNPAHLNTHYDWLTLEFGDTTAATDGTATPRAEGGMFKNAGNMIYGLYFGNESNTSNALRKAAGLTDAADLETNNIDLFVGGDAGVQWGARLTYSAYEDDANDRKSNAARLGLGVVSGNIDAFLNAGLGNAAEDGTVDYQGKSSIDLGLTYGMGDMDYMLRYQTVQVEDAEAEDEFSASNTWLGVAKTYKLNDKASAWASAWYKMDTSTCEFTTTSTTDGCSLAGVGTGDTKRTYLPVVIGMEVMAKEWLTFRGSVSHEVIGTSEADNGDTETRLDRTTVSAGASLVFGDLTIDGVIGNSADGNNASANATTGESTTAQGDGNLRTDNLMSRVSMTYKF